MFTYTIVRQGCDVTCRTRLCPPPNDEGQRQEEDSDEADASCFGTKVAAGPQRITLLRYGHQALGDRMPTDRETEHIPLK